MSILWDSYAARLDCGVHSTSQNVGAGEEFTMTLEFLKSYYPGIVKPGYTFNCNLCFTPIIDTMNSGVDPNNYVTCSHISGAIPDACDCPPCAVATRFTVNHPAPPQYFLDTRFEPWQGEITGVIPKSSCEWYSSNSCFEIWLSRALPSGSNAVCSPASGSVSGWSFWVRAHEEKVQQTTWGIRSAAAAEGVVIGDLYTGAGSKTAQGSWSECYVIGVGEGEVDPCPDGCCQHWNFNVAVAIQPTSIVDGEWT
jgi:hypothetical protein